MNTTLAMIAIGRSQLRTAGLRRVGLRLACAMLLVISAGRGPARADEPRLSVASGQETVFRWSSQRCSDLFIPDSPARAFRRADGSIVLIAAHYLNQFMAGRSFDRLAPDCATISKGRESGDPADFDTRYWIQALLPGPGGTIVGLASHEYNGARFGNCAKAAAAGPLCWYSSIVAVTADETGLRFTAPADLDRRIVAAPPRRFDPNRVGRYGFITTSNAIEQDGWAYVFIWSELGGQPGNCLFRAPVSDPLGGWVAYRDAAFSQRFADPYEAGDPERRCDPVGAGRLKAPLRSLIRIADRWVGVFAMNATGDLASGIYYSSSTDLIDWTAPRLLYGVQPWYGGKGCGEFFDYPSLIDHESPSRIFDRGGGDVYLYLTRMNWSDCNKGLNRDLVRVRVSVATP